MKESTLFKEQKAFAAEVVRLKHRAGDLKLYKTMHSLEEGVKAIGWELAEIIEGKAKYAE